PDRALAALRTIHGELERVRDLMWGAASRGWPEAAGTNAYVKTARPGCKRVRTGVCRTALAVARAAWPSAPRPGERARRQTPATARPERKGVRARTSLPRHSELLIHTRRTLPVFRPMDRGPRLGN